jgi:hypothetical protein
MELDLEMELEKSRQFQALADEKLVDISASDNSKNRAALAFFHLCLEHQHGLHVLVEQRIFGSALAILRPVYESYVRGMWSYHCASHDQIMAFIKRDKLPRIRQMVVGISTAVEGLRGMVQSHDAGWGWMNDYTHGGSSQIRARAQGDTIQNTQSEKHAAAALVTGRHWAFLAAVAMCDVCKRPDLYSMLHFQRLAMDGA